MAKKKNKKKSLQRGTLRASNETANQPGGKSKADLIQEVYDAEFKGAVSQYISNTIDIPAVGGDPKEAETRFLNALKRLRDTQPRVLQLLEGQ